MLKSLFYNFYLFFVYGTLGWIIEVVFHAVNIGEFVNRGFLNGAYCPIYGFGMIFIVWLLKPYMDKTWLLCLLAIGIATLIELVGGFLLEVLFHHRWWDYSDLPFNFKGYICVRFSLYWGIATLIAVKFINPIVDKIYSRLPTLLTYPLLSVLGCIMLADTVVTSISVLNMNKDLAELNVISQKLEAFSNNFGEHIADQVFRSQDAKKALDKKFNERIEAFSQKHKRLLMAFPKLQSKENGRLFKLAKEKLKGIKDKSREIDQQNSEHTDSEHTGRNTGSDTH